MRLLAALSVLLLASVALAFPNVGDTVEYKTKRIDGRGVKSSMWEKYVLHDYEADGQRYLVEREADLDGHYSKVVFFMAAADLIDREQILKVLNTCGKANIETITTAAGSFQTCRVEIETDATVLRYWFADVPFAVVQSLYQDKQNGSTSLTQLVSVKSGNQQ